MDPRRLAHDIKLIEEKIIRTKDKLKKALLENIMFMKLKKLNSLNDKHININKKHAKKSREKNKDAEKRAYQKFVKSSGKSKDRDRDRDRDRDEDENYERRQSRSEAFSSTRKSGSTRTERQMRSIVEKDHANNRLMGRLNSELDFRKTGYNKYNISKPYQEDEQRYQNDSDDDEDDDDDELDGLDENRSGRKDRYDDEYFPVRRYKKRSSHPTSFSSRHRHGFRRNVRRGSSSRSRY